MTDFVSKLLIILAIQLFAYNTGAATKVDCKLEKQHDNDFSTKEKSIEGAYDFLYHQMDQFHKSIIIYDEPDFSVYYPSGFMGAGAALDVDIYDHSNPCSGLTSMRIDYDFKKDVRYNWAGIYFQYPANNWGDRPGRNLNGAKRLSFWARAKKETKAQLKIGGINHFPHFDPSKRFSDSLASVWAYENKQKETQFDAQITFTEQWTKYTIDIQNYDLNSVIGGFSWLISRDEMNLENSIYLDDISIDLDKTDEPRFIQSYVSLNYTNKKYATNSAHIYDQALVMLALMARGEKEDLIRVEYLADALILAQEHDRFFSGGRLRNAYASGDLLTPMASKKQLKSNINMSLVTRLPGKWNKEKSHFEEDEYAVGSDVGNMAWAGIALVQAGTLPVMKNFLTEKKRQKYIKSADKIARWITEHHQTNFDEIGGFRGGFENPCGKFNEQNGFSASNWRSTEHNIDLYVLFKHLAKVAENQSKRSDAWENQANHSLKFIKKMWNSSGYFHTGTSPMEDIEKSRSELNESVIALDVQTWAVLALDKQMPVKVRQALNWALDHCRAEGIKHGYDFNCNDGDGAWWEGTSQVAAALMWLGENNQAEPILKRLRDVQVETMRSAPGAIFATSKDLLTTGIKKCRGDWTYPKEPHIGATAWYLFAAQNKNPYYLETKHEQ